MTEDCQIGFELRVQRVQGVDDNSLLDRDI